MSVGFNSNTFKSSYNTRQNKDIKSVAQCQIKMADLITRLNSASSPQEKMEILNQINDLNATIAKLQQPAGTSAPTAAPTVPPTNVGPGGENPNTKVPTKAENMTQLGVLIKKLALASTDKEKDAIQKQMDALKQTIKEQIKAEKKSTPSNKNTIEPNTDPKSNTKAQNYVLLSSLVKDLAKAETDTEKDAIQKQINAVKEQIQKATDAENAAKKEVGGVKKPDADPKNNTKTQNFLLLASLKSELSSAKTDLEKAEIQAKIDAVKAQLNIQLEAEKQANPSTNKDAGLYVTAEEAAKRTRQENQKSIGALFNRLALTGDKAEREKIEAQMDLLKEVTYAQIDTEAEETRKAQFEAKKQAKIGAIESKINSIKAEMIKICPEGTDETTLDAKVKAKLDALYVEKAKKESELDAAQKEELGEPTQQENQNKLGVLLKRYDNMKGLDYKARVQVQIDELKAKIAQQIEEAKAEEEDTDSTTKTDQEFLSHYTNPVVGVRALQAYKQLDQLYSALNELLRPEEADVPLNESKIAEYNALIVELTAELDGLTSYYGDDTYKKPTEEFKLTPGYAFKTPSSEAAYTNFYNEYSSLASELTKLKSPELTSSDKPDAAYIARIETRLKELETQMNNLIKTAVKVTAKTTTTTNSGTGRSSSSSSSNTYMFGELVTRMNSYLF